MKKIELFLFMLFLFFQNFALIKTSTFGISGLTIFLLLLSIRYNFYKKINIAIVMFCISLICLMLISAQYNSVYDLAQICRTLMIVFVMWATSKYICVIYSNNREKQFWNAFSFAIFGVCIYGIYQYFANKYSLPLFLNVFSNNPSYGARTVDFYYNGWADSLRIYGVFFEPSAYATFLAYCMLLIFYNNFYNKRKKVSLLLFCSINIFFTYSRSGWGLLGYSILIIVILNLLKKTIILKKLATIFFLFTPLINLSIMYKLQLNTFTDLSSYARTTSAVYYLKQSFNNIVDIFIGHGAGSMSANYSNTYLYQYLDMSPHNGYIELLYQFGLPFLVLIIAILCINIAKIKNFKYKVLAFASIFTVCSFGSSYNVESMISLIVIVYSYCIHQPSLTQSDNKVLPLKKQFRGI